ncbi:hypothetical protein NHF41_09035 [Pseudomonas proteolytica]|nr:hypothetical protein [Pseudomonas proteolytica]USX01942.1 hypothetical protein NHF41_09035 [Pseudomonas proteolytica]
MLLLFWVKVASAFERNPPRLQIEGDRSSVDALVFHPLAHFRGFEGVSQMGPPLAEGGVGSNSVDRDIFLAVGELEQRRVILHCQFTITLQA